MKIIDLLNKIANDGKIPERIKYNDYEYRYHDKEHGYCRSGYDCTYICLDSEYYLFDILNDEVEIIEEPRDIEVCGSWFTKSEYDELANGEEEKKIPEKLEEIGIQYNLGYIDYKNIETLKEWLNKDFQKIYDTIDLIIKNQNKLIDYLKSKGE